MTTQEQTDRCNRLREFLQSIAIQAVQAQEHIGADRCSDLLNDIESDLATAQSLQEQLITGKAVR